MQFADHARRLGRARGLGKRTGLGFLGKLGFEDRRRMPIGDEAIKVIDTFAESYIAGETPIPCVTCNNEIKFHDLLVTARELGESIASRAPESVAMTPLVTLPVPAASAT